VDDAGGSDRSAIRSAETMTSAAQQGTLKVIFFHLLSW
jgi:hypothetical protein